MPRIFTLFALMLALLAPLAIASPASANTLSLERAKNRLRVYGTAELARLQYRSIPVARFRITGCSRHNQYKINCTLNFRRLNGKQVCSERVQAYYPRADSMLPRVRRLSRCA